MPLAVAFLVLAAFQARHVFSGVLAQAQVAPLLLTIAGWSALHLLAPCIALAALRGQGLPISYATALDIHVRRLPARYLPGGIWHTVTRVVDLHRGGVETPQLKVMVLVENLVPLACATALGCLFALPAGSLGRPLLAGMLGGCVLLLAALPWTMRRWLPGTRISAAHYGAAIAAATLFWLAAASLFVLYWNAFPALGIEERVSELFSVYLLSWSAGFVAVFAPQGLGVFEAVAGKMLTSTMPFAAMAVLVAGFRASTLAGDGLAFVVGALVRWAGRRPGAPH